ncbi:YraN family protein [Gordonia sp. ABKF26]|uniref:YraN family protein n=1 Tax=Gordonia sp. ABKF26 TaxID=3238687 RepID=UPI0034E38D26
MSSEPRGHPRPDRRGHIGRLGEDVAADYATSLGWVVLDRNWRTRYGELDLVACDGSILVIVEVKTRASRTYDDPVMAVTPTKLTRMRRLARLWLAAQDRRWSQIRFDVVSVRLDQATPDDLARARVRHHRGVYV